jgi:competence protein ComGC
MPSQRKKYTPVYILILFLLIIVVLILSVPVQKIKFQTLREGTTPTEKIPEDVITYENAINTGDISLCEKISDGITKSQCIASLTPISPSEEQRKDADLYMQAIESGDIKICDKISNPVTKQQCISSLTAL